MREYKSCGKWQEKTYSTASIGSLDLGQVLHVAVEDVHLLNQAAQGSLSGLTNLLIDLLGLERRKVTEKVGQSLTGHEV